MSCARRRPEQGKVTGLVIPGRAATAARGREAASPESILPTLGYGFRARACGATRNDGVGTPPSRHLLAHGLAHRLVERRQLERLAQDGAPGFRGLDHVAEAAG